MNNKQLYESIMQEIAYSLKNIINEAENNKKIYKMTYRSGYMYIFDEDKQVSLRETNINPKCVNFYKNDLDEYIDDRIKRKFENLHICDPYYNKGKICFDIECDQPFTTPIQGYGKNVILKDAVNKYMAGQLSDGWGENGVGTLKKGKDEYTLFT